MHSANAGPNGATKLGGKGYETRVIFSTSTEYCIVGYGFFWNQVKYPPA